MSYIPVIVVFENAGHTNRKITRGLRMKINIWNVFPLDYRCGIHYCWITILCLRAILIHVCHTLISAHRLSSQQRKTDSSARLYIISGSVNVVAVRGAETKSAVFEANERWKFQFDTFFWLFIFWEGNDMQFFLRQESGANCALQQKALKVMRCEPTALEAYLFESCSCNLWETCEETQPVLQS